MTKQQIKDEMEICDLMFHDSLAIKEAVNKMRAYIIDSEYKSASVEDMAIKMYDGLDFIFERANIMSSTARKTALGLINIKINKEKRNGCV